MRWCSVAAIAPAVAGCSLIYNPNNLPDPRMIDAAVVDANPCALVLDDIAPTVVLEGSGAGNSAPAVLVVHGNNIVNAKLRVELKAKDGTAVQLDPISGALASGDTTFLAFTVVAPVDPALGKSGPADVPLDVTVTQDAPQDGGCMGAATQTLSGKLTYRALPELTAMPVTSQLYSSITLLGTVPFTGTTRAELNAVSTITLGAVVASATDATAGPGGYSAGNVQGPGGGQPGFPATALGSAGGGGGAGFGTAGFNGAKAATNGGTGGPANGEPQILSYDNNRASAGGEGGVGLSTLGGVAGGPGGGGGGMVVLNAGGDITTGTVTANGASGGNGKLVLVGSGGGGGGGAGGTVLVRSAAGTLTMQTIHVAGGGAGAPGGGQVGAAGSGGAGGPGRVRWDSPMDKQPPSPDSPPHRGPSFKAVMPIVTMRQPAMLLVGTPGDELDVRVIDDRGTPHAGSHVAFDPSGSGTFTPTLSPGYNRVCVKLAMGSESEPAANACVDVAYLPPKP